MRFVLVLAVMCAGGVPHSRAEPAPTATDPNYAETETEDDAVDPLTTQAWRPARTFDLHWQLLYLPQRILEIALSPIGLLLEATDTYRLDRRVIDLLELFDGRIVIRPRFKFAFTDGPGLGAKVTRAHLFDRRAELSLGAIYRTSNGDWQAALEYEHGLLLPGGRGLRARTEVEHDQNRRYYGIGSTTERADRRALSADHQAVVAEVDLQGIDRYTYSGIVEVAMRRQTLEVGVDPGHMPLGIDGDSVAPPAGFDDTAIYGDLRAVGRYDTRDTAARPTRGWLIAIGGLARAEVTGKDLSALTLTANARLHLPIIAEGRTLAISLGGTASTPLFPGHSVPLDSLATIGRANVRGYDRDRFRDRFEVHGSIEYRFPIYEYLASKIGLDALLFVDGGTSFGTDPKPLDSFRYSVGGGLRGAHETALIFEGVLGWSPEGPQLVLGVEKTL